MAGRDAARPRSGQGRAGGAAVRSDIDIVQQRLQAEWRRACAWALAGAALTVGPFAATAAWLFALAGA